MTEDEAAAQAQLREIAKELSTLCLRLEAIHDQLPVPPQDNAMLLGEEEMNVALRIRTAIECGLHDNLRPVIRDFQAAASYRPPGEEGA